MIRPPALALAAIATAAPAALAQQTIRVPEDIPTLNLALNPVVSGLAAGDTISLTQGTYFTAGSFPLVTPNITIAGRPGQTPILDSVQSGRLFTIGPGESGLTLRGLLLTRGETERGGAIAVEDADITLIDVTIEDCVANDDGGAIVVIDGNLTLQNVTLRNNITDDTDAFGNSDGGAIRLENNAVAVINDSLFENNTAADDGGAISATDATLTITNTTFRNNTTDTLSGGAIQANLANITIVDSTFERNISSGFGGAISATASAIDIARSAFIANEAPTTGGAVTIRTGSTGTIAATEFRYNRSTAGSGGALGLVGSPVVTIASRFYANAAEFDGGAIFIQGETNEEADVFNSIFVGNTGRRGAAIAGASGPDLTVLGCTLVDNTATEPNGGTIVNLFTATGLRIRNSILRAPAAPAFSAPAPATVISSNVQFLFGQPFDLPENHNIDAAPLFVRSPSDGGDGFGDNPLTMLDESLNDDFGDLRLQQTSPSIDAGDANLYLTNRSIDILTINPIDIAGLPRVITANGYDPAMQADIAFFAQIPDHGAHELQRATDPDVDRNETLDFFDVLEFLDIFDAATAP